MRAVFTFAMLLAAGSALHAEIIDRIAVTVGNRVITRGGLVREMRVAAFLDGRPAETSPAARREAAGRMVEQLLIRRELETSRYPAPSPAEVTPLLDQLKRERFPDAAAYARALADYEITEQDLKEELLWQRTLLLFIEVRFRPGIQVTDAEIQEYFEKTVKPAAQAAHPGQPVALEDYRARIETTLAGPRVDRDMDNWLKEVRGRTEVIYHEEAFQ
jgi:peptidyl-prolyl cis-trans isomerase SurA